MFQRTNSTETGVVPSPAEQHRRFEQLVRQHQDRIFGFACFYLSDRDAAADVTQEVLIRFWRHRKKVDDDRALGWLLRVTRNACIDALRSQRRHFTLMDVDTDLLDDHEGDFAAPDQTVEAADFRDMLRAALDRLAEPYRSIVILRELQDLKYEEICGALDLPLTTVKVYLHRGRKMLRDQMRPTLAREMA